MELGDFSHAFRKSVFTTKKRIPGCNSAKKLDFFKIKVATLFTENYSSSHP